MGQVAGGEQSVTFLRTLARAERATAAEEWAEAARLWQEIVAVNPVEGRFWRKLGEARRQAKIYRDAIEALEEAFALRDGFPAATLYEIARCQALLGDREAALTALERALDLGYRHLDRLAKEDDFQSLREDPRFRDLAGLVETDGLSRDDGWRMDVRFLAREIERRAYDPFRFTSREAFRQAVDALEAAIPDLSDMQIIVAMNALLRPLGDGHAGVWPARELEAYWRRLPVQFAIFDEGLFIVAAEPAQQAVLGAQVLRLGERTAEEAMAAVDAIVHRDNGNDQWPKRQIPRLLRLVPLLHALGVAESDDALSLELRGLDGTMRRVVVPADLVAPDERRFPYPEGWISLPETLPVPPPHYLRNLELAYWFEYLPEERTVYFQFNAVRDEPTEPLGTFTERLFRFIDDHEVAKLVVDIRWNGGGNTFLEMPLLHRLIGSKVNQRGALFVIIGRGTFSAAQNLANLLDRHTAAIFVGEPTGSSPSFIGETVEFTLPWSKTEANVSDLLWQEAWALDYRTWLAPTLYAPPTFATFRANRDPALEAILACREQLPGMGPSRWSDWLALGGSVAG